MFFSSFVPKALAVNFAESTCGFNHSIVIPRVNNPITYSLSAKSLTGYCISNSICWISSSILNEANFLITRSSPATMRKRSVHVSLRSFSSRESSFISEIRPLVREKIISYGSVIVSLLYYIFNFKSNSVPKIESSV